MKNQIVLITGATGGIGKQTATSLAKLGATVVMVGRNKTTGLNVVDEIIKISSNKNIDFIEADLSTISGMKSLVSRFKSKYSSLDILINNAGLAPNKLKITDDGFEESFAVNVIAPYVLVEYFKDFLFKSTIGRVITLTGGNLPSKIDIHNLEGEKSFEGLKTYSDRKIAMMCVMYELAEKYKGKLNINVCYPGQAKTNMTKSVTKEMMPGPFKGLTFAIFNSFVSGDDKGKSAEKASRSSVYLASSSEFSSVTGKYVNTKCKITPWPKSVLDKTNREYIYNYVITKLKLENISYPG